VTHFSYITNYFHIRVRRLTAITNAVMLSCVRTPDVWECNHVRDNFDDKLWLRHFRKTKTIFEMVCNEIGQL